MNARPLAATEAAQHWERFRNKAQAVVGPVLPAQLLNAIAPQGI
jgi:hypothetical protein